MIVFFFPSFVSLIFFLFFWRLWWLDFFFPFILFSRWIVLCVFSLNNWPVYDLLPCIFEFYFVTVCVCLLVRHHHCYLCEFRPCCLPHVIDLYSHLSFLSASVSFYIFVLFSFLSSSSFLNLLLSFLTPFLSFFSLLYSCIFFFLLLFLSLSSVVYFFSFPTFYFFRSLNSSLSLSL